MEKNLFNKLPIEYKLFLPTTVCMPSNLTKQYSTIAAYVRWEREDRRVSVTAMVELRYCMKNLYCTPLL